MNKTIWILALTIILIATSTLAYSTNGSTLIFNNTLPIIVNDHLASSPFIFIETPTTLRYTFTYNNTNLVMDTATIQIDNNTYNLTYNIWENQYQIQITFNSSEIGDYPFTVTGTLSGFDNATLDAIYQVRDFITANFQIYTAVNKSTKYKDGFADIIAIPQNMSDSEEYVELVKPFTYLNDWMDLKLGIGGDKELFRSSQRVFFTDYDEDGTNLYLPANQSYTYYLVSGNQEYDGEYYAYMFYTKQYFSIYLVQDHIYNDTNYEVYVTKWETNWLGSFFTILIWTVAFILIFAIPFMVFQNTGNPEMLGKAIIIVIPVVGVLALIIQGVVAWLM